MATINCTIQEYHQHIGPRIRNAINGLTRNARKKRDGICEHCGKKGVLDSAHIHGKGRRDLIELVLNEYTSEGNVNGDLDEIEQKILEKHQPIENVFKFLCKSCHVEYDNDLTRKTNVKNINIRTQIKSADNNTEFQKITRIKLWAKKPHQANHKIIKAYLELAKEGNVTYESLKRICSNKLFRKDLHVEKFDGHFASMKTDNGNSHGKVFYEELGFVMVYPQVMREINQHFNIL